MSQIVIRIDVPDGVKVSVEREGERAFTERPAPARPPGFCEVHDKDWKLVPAGTSKAGKRYNAFWVCPVRDCTERPPKEAPADESF